MERKQVAEAWRIPDELWQKVEPLLPKYRRCRKGGRPRLERRRVLDGIFGGDSKALPLEALIGYTFGAFRITARRASWKSVIGPLSPVPTRNVPYSTSEARAISGPTVVEQASQHSLPPLHPLRQEFLRTQRDAIFPHATARRPIDRHRSACR